MFLEKSIIYFVVIFTTTAIFFLAVNRFDMKPQLLSRAVRDAIQIIGAAVLFFVLNFAVGVSVVFLIRGVWRFFPLYTIADEALLIVSGLQGFVFQLWWRLSHERQR
jgi:hypothetical protein